MAQVKTAWTIAVAGLAAAFAVLALGAPLQATQLQPLGEEELVKESDWIGLVEVVGTRTEWKKEMLWTLVDLKVADKLKGRASESMVLVVPGGIDTARGIEQRVPGVPTQPAAGSRMIVFAKDSRFTRRAIQPVALAQGILFVDPDSLAANRLFQAESAGSAAPARLGELLDAIRSEIEREIAEQMRMREFLEREIEHVHQAHDMCCREAPAL
jgi:hypothetical protein